MNISSTVILHQSFIRKNHNFIVFYSRRYLNLNLFLVHIGFQFQGKSSEGLFQCNINPFFYCRYWSRFWFWLWRWTTTLENTNIGSPIGAHHEFLSHGSKELFKYMIHIRRNTATASRSMNMNITPTATSSSHWTKRKWKWKRHRTTTSRTSSTSHIIHSPFIRVTQRFICFIDFLKFRTCIGTGVLIRMIF